MAIGRDVASVFGLGEEANSAPKRLLPFLLPFLPLLLLPSLSFSSFRIPFSSRILFPGVSSSYTLNLAMSGEHVWGALWHHKFTILGAS